MNFYISIFRSRNGKHVTLKRKRERVKVRKKEREKEREKERKRERGKMFINKSRCKGG